MVRADKAVSTVMMPDISFVSPPSWLARIYDDTELGSETYTYGRLTGITLELESGPVRALNAACVYLSKRGCLTDHRHDGQPRAIGLSAVSPPPRRGKAQPEGQKVKRRRRPTVRALRAAETLRQNSSLEETPAGVEPLSDGRSNSTTCVARDKESGDGTQGPQAAWSGTC